jgi:hypothetical protein
MRRAWFAIVAVLGAAAPAVADDSHPGDPTYRANVVSPDRAIVVTSSAPRSVQNIALSAGIATAGIVLAGVGLYYNLDSRDAANAVSPQGPTGQAWTAADQADYDRAHSSGVKAGVFYGVGGGLLIAAVVTWIATAPGEQHEVIRPHTTPTVMPTPGGALIGELWRF